MDQQKNAEIIGRIKYLMKELGVRQVQFAERVGKYLQAGKDVVFVVGGAYGFGPSMYERAQAKLSLSKMTCSHQLVRTVFAEQLYRAFTILKGEPYHNE